MEVKGVIKLINPTKEYGEKGFKKREVVVTTIEDYPQDILVEFVQSWVVLCQHLKAKLRIQGD